jgi:hypothetical protein
MAVVNLNARHSSAGHGRANGIHSAVRGHVVGGVVPTFARQIVWHSLAPLRLPEPPGMQFWLGRAASSGCARWVTGAPTGSRTSPPRASMTRWPATAWNNACPATAVHGPATTPTATPGTTASSGSTPPDQPRPTRVDLELRSDQVVGTGLHGPGDKGPGGVHQHVQPVTGGCAPICSRARSMDAACVTSRTTGRIPGCSAARVSSSSAGRPAANTTCPACARRTTVARPIPSQRAGEHDGP